MENAGFVITPNGLAEGRTSYGYSVGKAFFESFGNTGIMDADLQVTADVEKSGQYLGIDCRISGNVTVECDRCLDPLVLPVETTALLSIKFGEGQDRESEDEVSPDREVVRLPSDDAELDLAQVIYDYACLSLPSRRTHPDGGCNPKVLEYLESGISVQGSETEVESNPFASLKGLFGN